MRFQGLSRLRRAASSPARSISYALQDRYGPKISVIPSDVISRLGGHSQLGQDLLVRRLFGNRPGVFIDVGAHDGITLNNTWLLEQHGWTGICIEPNPTVFKQTEKTRARAVYAAVGDKPGSMPFRVVEGYAEMLSGLEHRQGRRELERIKREVREYGGTWTTIEVNVRRLDDILCSEGIERVDYLSIDVEGGEAGVLASINLAEFDIGILTVENNYGSAHLRRTMRRRGYIQVFRMGHDDVFVQQKLARLF